MCAGACDEGSDEGCDCKKFLVAKRFSAVLTSLKEAAIRNQVRHRLQVTKLVHVPVDPLFLALRTVAERLVYSSEVLLERLARHCLDLVSAPDVHGNPPLAPSQVKRTFAFPHGWVNGAGEEILVRVNELVERRGLQGDFVRWRGGRPQAAKSGGGGGEGFSTSPNSSLYYLRFNSFSPLRSEGFVVISNPDALGKASLAEFVGLPAVLKPADPRGLNYIELLDPTNGGNVRLGEGSPRLILIILLVDCPILVPALLLLLLLLLLCDGTLPDIRGRPEFPIVLSPAPPPSNLGFP